MSCIESVCNKLKSGVIEVISDIEFKLLLTQKKDLVIKIGFDPTSSKLHLGHLVILKKLREFQVLGYFVHLVVGDFTASIGDPSGKNSARQSILNSEVKKNYINYDNYFFKLLDTSRLIIYFNSVWFNFMLLSDFIQLLSFSTISRVLERSDFKHRYLNNLSVGIHELIYPLLQSYDSVFLFADIEIGGIDQKFNLLLARDMQKKFYQRPQVLLMLPILIGLDGTAKMSKSLNNYVALDEDSYELFCKIMSLPDSALKDYYFAFNFDYLNENQHPMNLKLDLSFNIVSLLHGKKVAESVKSKFINRVSKSDFTDMVVSDFFISGDFIALADLLLLIKFVDSMSEYKRLLKFLAISINNEIVRDRHFLLFVNNIYLIKVGKKKSSKMYILTKKIDK